MANREGGSAGFGWLVVGVLLGVVGTLAFQLFSGKSETEEADAPPAHALSVAPAALAPPAVATVTKPRVKALPQPASSAAPIAPATSDAQNASQIADDAAAAGMTSRATN